MKKHKASGLPKQVAEMIQATGLYWYSVANRSMQWYRKGGMYSRALEIEYGIINLQGQG